MSTQAWIGPVTCSLQTLYMNIARFKVLVSVNEILGASETYFLWLFKKICNIILRYWSLFYSTVDSHIVMGCRNIKAALEVVMVHLSRKSHHYWWRTARMNGGCSDQGGWAPASQSCCPEFKFNTRFVDLLLSNIVWSRWWWNLVVALFFWRYRICLIWLNRQCERSAVTVWPRLNTLKYTRHLCLSQQTHNIFSQGCPI